MKRVLIIEAQIKQYRLPFYEQLVSALRNIDIELRVGFSDPSPTEAMKNDTCDLPTEYGLKVPGYWVVRERLLLQPLLRPAMAADLVIVDQGNRFLLNHLLLPLSRAGGRRIAFWGLGENRQHDQLRLSEWYRLKTLNWVSWWFAYTNGTARYLVANGVPHSKITAVDNAVDTAGLRQQVQQVSNEDRMALRSRIGITSTAPVGIFCGMLDPVKNIPFLIEAARMIRARVSDFQLILVGGGPDRQFVQSVVRGAPWIHLMGPRFSQEKADLIAISDVFVMPGRVGLVILDAFAGGLPMFTTRLDIHGPEIEYLEHGVNGLLSEPSVGAFADSVVEFLSNPQALERLRAGARESATKYTIENMVAKFIEGIQGCLDMRALRAGLVA